MEIVEETEFTIATYNINFAFCRKQRGPTEYKILQGIKETQAKILCLQETHEQWESFLKHELKNTYPHSVFHHSSGSGGVAIFSQFPIEVFRIIKVMEEVKGSWFPIMQAFLKLSSGNSLQIINVHLRPPVREDGSANLFTASQTNPIRKAELEYLSNKVQFSESGKSIPTIVLGDFNENDGAPGLNFMESLGFKDALHEKVPSNIETHRWPLWIFTLKKRLDHILYSSSDFSCLECKVVKGYEEGASDHQPVVAKLQFKSIK